LFRGSGMSGVRFCGGEVKGCGRWGGMGEGQSFAGVLFRFSSEDGSGALFSPAQVADLRHGERVLASDGERGFRGYPSTGTDVGGNGDGMEVGLGRTR
jgi:hypothetical protein